MNKLRSRKAFTIVEMVIVIAVIAILATVLVPTISGVIQKANVSADQQFAASLNVQLALWQVDNGAIKNENDLRNAINHYYGEFDENGNLINDYYASLAPKSGKHGYHFWYDVENKRVELSKYDSLAGTESTGFSLRLFGVALADEVEEPTTEESVEQPVITFSPASIRSLAINGKNYFLMDQAGSELIDIVVGFENLGDDSKVGSGSNMLDLQYEYIVNLLKDSAVANSLEQILLSKVEITTIVTGEGAYRFNNVDAIQYIYIPMSATIINVQNVYEYVPGTDGADGMVNRSNTLELANPTNVTVVQIPVGVKIASNGFPAMSELKNEDLSNPVAWSNVTILEIMANSISELTNENNEFMFDIQTSNPVFKLVGSSQLYVMINDKPYTLPYAEGNAPVEIEGVAGTGTSQNLDVKVEFPNASVDPGKGTHYLAGDILYVQYDQTDVAINVKNGAYVTWEYSVDGVVSVSGDKLSILKEIAVGENNQIKVTGKINGEEKVSFTVCLVMPREIQVGEYNSTEDGVGVVGARPIEIMFDGNNSSISFDFSVNYGSGQNNKVNTWPISVASKDSKFTVALDEENTKLTITLKADTYDFEDVLNVTVGTKTFSIAVKCLDNSAAAFENKLFYDDPSTTDYEQGKDIKIGEKYLFRVGNKNGITLGQLFATDKAYANVAFKLHDYSNPVVGSGIQSVTVSNTATKSGDYYTTSNSQWGDVSITFGKTGVVKIEIGQVVDGEFMKDAYILLDVVEGTNITSYGQLTSSGNQVLWADITMSKDGTYALSNGTLFGNGFTFNVEEGAYQKTTNGYASEMYVICLSNARLDNVKIVGKVYKEFNITGKSDYNRAIVLSLGNSEIYNSYISNGAAPVRIYSGTLVIDKTTLKGGSYANLDIQGGKITLRDVTTINQVNGNDKAEDGTTPIGLGIAVWYEQVNKETTVTVEGYLRQYNYIAKNQTGSLKNDYAKQFANEMFAVGELGLYRYDDGTTIWVNTGILSMIDTFGVDNVKPEVISGYKSISVSAKGQNGRVWTVVTDSTNYNSVPAEWEATDQEEISPKYTWDWTGKNYQEKVIGSNDYCYHDGNNVVISMDERDTKEWDVSILTAIKNGNNLSYRVFMNDVEYTGKSIPFSVAGDYTVKYIITDSNNYDLEGNRYDREYIETVMVSVSVVKATAKNAIFDFGGNGYKTETIGNDTYVMPTGNTNQITINGVAVNYVMVNCAPSNGKYENNSTSYWNMIFPVFDGVVTITDYADEGTGAEIVYNSSTKTKPNGLTLAGYASGSSGAKTFTAETNASKIFQYSSKAEADNSPTTFNNKLVYKSPQLSNNGRSEGWLLVKYQYQDNAGKIYYYIVCYHTPEMVDGGSGCFTPDTLITLSDGTQKRIDEINSEDKILAWDFFTGSYVEKDISILVNHGEELYKVTKLEFSDGTQIKIIAEHGIFDYDLNKFVYFTAENYADYVGHRFVKQNLNGGYDIVQLVSGSVTEEYTSAWSISSAETSNAFASGLLTVAPPEDFYNWIEMSDKLQYNVEQFMTDVEKYGLYTYEDFADYVTYEQFVEWNGAYLKVAVEKGYFTFEYILELIELYKEWMP